MPRQLPADCLNEIFEYLEDKVDLYSCLLVNRLWCEVSVRILWTNIQNYKTLIACLPNESKEILYKNDIIISTPTSKPLLFNYVTFIKNLSIFENRREIRNLLTVSQRFDNNKYMVIIKEIFKNVYESNFFEKIESLFKTLSKYTKHITIYHISWRNGLFKKSFRINLLFRYLF